MNRMSVNAFGHPDLDILKYLVVASQVTSLLLSWKKMFPMVRGVWVPVKQCMFFLPSQAVTLSCAHSFCQHCIADWRRRRDECPICRQPIVSQARSLVLDNCIDRMVENLSTVMRERRTALISQRKGERCVLSAHYTAWFPLFLMSPLSLNSIFVITR